MDRGYLHDRPPAYAIRHDHWSEALRREAGAAGRTNNKHSALRPAQPAEQTTGSRPNE